MDLYDIPVCPVCKGDLTRGDKTRLAQTCERTPTLSLTACLCYYPMVPSLPLSTSINSWCAMIMIHGSLAWFCNRCRQTLSY